MTNIKKVVAGASAIAILTMNMINFTANAAALNDAAWAVAVDDITITKAGAFAGSATCTTMVSANGGAPASRVCAVTDANVLTITDPDGSVDGWVTAGFYVITFNTNDGVFGSVTVDTGTYNDVTVTATVAPILTMSLSETALTLWTLTTGTYSTDNIIATVSTNALAGADVTMASVWLKDTVIDREIWVTDIAANPQTAATDYYKATTNGAPVLTDVNDGLANAGGTDVVASQVVYNGTWPVNAQATTITVGSKIWATTEAGNYSDTLTFTVTGSF